MTGVTPVDYLILNVKHRTNEDWVLDLPLSISSSDLVGATAACQLQDKSQRMITLDCEIVGQTVQTRLDWRKFSNLQGSYTGDLLLTLSGDRDIVTHIINLDLSLGITHHG